MAKEFIISKIAFVTDRILLLVQIIFQITFQLIEQIHKFMQPRESQDLILENQLKVAQNYGSWHAIAMEIDRLRNFDDYKTNNGTL
jgi:hypothetical protein